MHTFEHDNVRFHFDGDALTSPNSMVHIRYPDAAIASATYIVEVPAAALVAFVAMLVRRGRISAIEDQNDLEVLGVREKKP
jgi:hypothetical protein